MSGRFALGRRQPSGPFVQPALAGPSAPRPGRTGPADRQSRRTAHDVGGIRPGRGRRRRWRTHRSTTSGRSIACEQRGPDGGVRELRVAGPQVQEHGRQGRARIAQHAAVARVARSRVIPGERPEAASSAPSGYAAASSSGSSKKRNSHPGQVRHRPGRTVGRPRRRQRIGRRRGGSSRRPRRRGRSRWPAIRSARVVLGLGEGERPGPDRLRGRTGRSASWSTGTSGQQVGRGDRLGRRLEEPTERRREREHDRLAPVDRDAVTSFHDPAPGPR